MLANLMLKEVQPRAFCGLEYLVELHLSKNELRGPPELLPVRRTLKTLELSHNKISCFPPLYFSGFKELRVLEIKDNFLSTIPNLGFVGASLRSFIAYRNQIESLDSLLQQDDLRELRMLNVALNNIKTLNVKIFSKVPKVAYFELMENKLRHLDDFRPYLVNWNSTLSMPVSLIANPWDCGPRLAWMLELKGIKGVPKAQLFCHSPACRNGSNIFILSLYHYSGITWVSSSLSSLATRLFSFFRSTKNSKSNIADSFLGLWWGSIRDSLVTDGLRPQRARGLVQYRISVRNSS